MHDPQDDDATREAEAVDATDMAPTVLSAPGSDAVVDAFAWSQEEDGAGAEPLPYVDDPYEQDPGTTRRVAVSPATAVPGRRTPTRWPRIALIVGSGVALIAVAGALYSLARTAHEDAPETPVTSTAVVPPVLSSSLPASTPAPPPVVTTSAAPPPPPTTTAPPPTTTTAPPTTTTTTAPPTTTTTTAPPTTTTAPPSSSEPPTTTAPPTSTTVPMTTEYLTIPFVPVPIPITVPQN